MGKHFFVLMYGTNEFEKNVTKFQSFHHLDEVTKMVSDWLEQACGMECVPHGREEAVREANGGVLPEMAFLCPEVRQPGDLAQYNGFYDYEGIGVFSLFLTPVYDHATAVKFRGGMIKEFGIDQDLSEEADRMMELLDLFVASFDEEGLDYAPAEEGIWNFLMMGGFSLFGDGEGSPECSIVDASGGFHPTFGL